MCVCLLRQLRKIERESVRQRYREVEREMREIKEHRQRERD